MMPAMHPVLWLLLQAAAAAGAAWLLLRGGLPGLAALHRARHPDVPAFVSGWLAIAVAMPAIVAGSLLGRGEAAAAGPAGAAAAAPAFAALAALGTALLAGAGRGRSRPPAETDPGDPARRGAADDPGHPGPPGPPGGPGGPPDPRAEDGGTAAPELARTGWTRHGPDLPTRGAVVAAFTLLFVLVLERHVTVWTGQVGLALLAVLLWLGGPPKRSAAETGSGHGGDRDGLGPEVRRTEGACGLAIMGAVALGLVEGLAARFAITTSEALMEAGGTGRGVPGLVLATLAAGGIAVRTIVLAAAAGVLPHPLGRRAAAWILAVGACGAVGAAALVRLPEMVRLAASGLPLPGSVLGGGFGAWAPAAAAALAVLAGLGLTPRGGLARVAGIACLVAAGLAATSSLG